ncbi:hypothetical protein F6455_14170 [Proteobacteria bacterium 005FR1]|nr:hypothetical protein [Proteobacteria bacterium 005FR1]
MIIIGDWQVEPDTCELVRGEQSLKIPARSMDVLVYFAKNRGRAVTPDELIEKFWRSSSTTDHAVHKIVAALRRALGDSAQKPSYIKTLPKRGYILIADVAIAAPVEQGIEAEEAASDATVPVQQQVSDTPPRQPEVSRPGAHRGLTSFIAIAALVTLTIGALLMEHRDSARPPADLPKRIALTNPQGLSQLDPSQRHQISAFIDSLKTRIADLPDVDVMAPALADTSEAEASQAQHALSTTAYSTDGHLHVFVNLVRIKDGLNLYSERFRLTAGFDSLSQQAAVDAVVNSLGVLLDEVEYQRMLELGTQNALAYKHFREARFYGNQYNHRDWQTALEQYQFALEKDPQFVNAYLGLAKTAHHMAIYSRDARVDALSRTVLDLSRRLSIAAPDSPTLETLKSIRMSLEGNNHFQQEREYRQQILDGNASGHVYANYALLLIGARLYTEAEQFLALAQQSPVKAISINEAWNFTTQVLPPDKLAEVKTAQLLDHPSHIGILGTAVSSLAFLGEFEKAKRFYQRQKELDQDGVRAHLSEVILAYSSGEITSTQFRAAGSPSPIQGGASELLNPKVLNDPDLAFNNGVLSFMMGDLQSGVNYWRNLTRIDKRKLLTRLHAIEIFFPAWVLQEEAYTNLLEQQDVGKSWQRRLMEGVLEMSDVTGIELDPQSRTAYEKDKFMQHNNAWRAASSKPHESRSAEREGRAMKKHQA